MGNEIEYWMGAEMKRTRTNQQAKAKARVKAVKARVLDLCVKKDKTIRQASVILKEEGFEKGVSRTRVGVALQEIAQDMSAQVPAERQKAYNRLQRFLDELEEAKRDGTLNLRASISESLQVMDRLSRLLGLDQPIKTINANISPTVPAMVAMDFSSPVEKTSALVSDAEYLDAVDESNQPFTKARKHDDGL
jgi:hypothetical protein